MRNIKLAVLMVCLGGCDEPIPQDFSGSVVVNRVNGNVISIDITLPTSSGSLEVTGRDNADRLIRQIESILVDLKSARDQFPVKETIPAAHEFIPGERQATPADPQ